MEKFGGELVERSGVNWCRGLGVNWWRGLWG